jgi:hypothetical protein
MTGTEMIQIWKDMFSNKSYTTYRGKPYERIYYGEGLRVFRIPVDTKFGPMQINIVEQNPKKNSRPAIRSQEGAKIAWFIPPKGDWWRVEDGLVYRGYSSESQ